jgi:hypothetical protein
MGLLRIKGTLDLNQFWPTGKSPNIVSDADTVHVQVDPKTLFEFEGNVTRAFEFAWVTTRRKSTTETRRLRVATAHVRKG